MRISDWSSDVCSSDLEPHLRLLRSDADPERALVRRRSRRAENNRLTMLRESNRTGRGSRRAGNIAVIRRPKQPLPGVVHVWNDGPASARIACYVHSFVVVRKLQRSCGTCWWNKTLYSFSYQISTKMGKTAET